MSDRKPSVFAWIAGVVLALLGLYVGAYYAMVDRESNAPIGVDAFYPIARSGDAVRMPASTGHLWVELSGTATNMQQSLRMFFAPIHWFDRRLRPQVWEPYRDSRFPDDPE